MVCYFSGTGNSALIATYIAEHIQDELLSLNDRIRADDLSPVRSERPLIFIVPTYAWKMPRLVTQFLERMVFEGNTDAYFLLTCGDDIGNAAAAIRRLCATKGFTFKGVVPVIMPENYIIFFSAPSEDEAQVIFESALPEVSKAADCILSGKSFPVTQPSLLDRLKSGIINRGFYTFMIHSKKFYATDACIHCGMCASVCPIHAIELTEAQKLPKWNGHCTHCMACISKCPVQAIEYGRRTHGKRRYTSDALKRV